MILLVGGEKGGVGKSLIAVSLATMRALEGYDVLVIDADRQASATLWSNIRVADQIRPAVACVEKTGDALGAAVKDLATRYDDVVIDAGGQDSVELRAGLTVADVVLFPLGYGVFDLGTLDKLAELVDLVKPINPGLIAKVLVNRAETHPNMKEAQTAQDVIGEYANLDLLRVVMRNRIAFSRALEQGRCALELKPQDEAAIAELTGVYEGVFKCLVPKML